MTWVVRVTWPWWIRQVEIHTWHTYRTSFVWCMHAVINIWYSLSPGICIIHVYVINIWLSYYLAVVITLSRLGQWKKSHRNFAFGYHYIFLLICNILCGHYDVWMNLDLIFIVCSLVFTHGKSYCSPGFFCEQWWEAWIAFFHNKNNNNNNKENNSCLTLQTLSMFSKDYGQEEWDS